MWQPGRNNNFLNKSFDCFRIQFEKTTIKTPSTKQTTHVWTTPILSAKSEIYRTKRGKIKSEIYQIGNISIRNYEIGNISKYIFRELGEGGGGVG